jgi:hypothetical protein
MHLLMISRIEDMVIAMRKHKFPHSNSMKQWQCLETWIMLQPLGVWKLMTLTLAQQQRRFNKRMWNLPLHIVMGTLPNESSRSSLLQ